MAMLRCKSRSCALLPSARCRPRFVHLDKKGLCTLLRRWHDAVTGAVDAANSARKPAAPLLCVNVPTLPTGSDVDFAVPQFFDQSGTGKVHRILSAIVGSEAEVLPVARSLKTDFVSCRLCVTLPTFTHHVSWPAARDGATAATAGAGASAGAASAADTTVPRKRARLTAGVSAGAAAGTSGGTPFNMKVMNWAQGNIRLRAPVPSNRQRGHHNGLFCEPSFADFVCAANGLFSLEALWHGEQPWMAEPGVRTHYFDAGMVSLLQGKDPASGILSQSMRSGRQQRRRVRKEWTPDRLPSADAPPPPEAGVGVAAGAPAAAGVASSVKYIDPAHRGSSDAYKKKVRRQTAVRYGNIPQNVFAAEQKLSAASQRTGSVVDFLSYVSVFAEVSRCPLSWRCMRMFTATLIVHVLVCVCLLVCVIARSRTRCTTSTPPGRCETPSLPTWLQSNGSTAPFPLDWASLVATSCSSVRPSRRLRK